MFPWILFGLEVDFLGQILLQMGYDVPEGVRTPADLKIYIPQFVYKCRGYFQNTKLTLDILSLDNIDRTQRLNRLESLIKIHRIHEPPKSKVDYTLPQRNLAKFYKKPNNVIRFNSYPLPLTIVG